MIRHFVIAALFAAAPVWADEVYDFTFQKADSVPRAEAPDEVQTQAEESEPSPTLSTRSSVEVGPTYFNNGWYNERGIMAAYAWNFTERFNMDADMILVLSQSYEDTPYGTESQYSGHSTSPRLAVGVGFAPVIVHSSNGAAAFSLSFLTGVTSFEELVQDDFCPDCLVRTTVAPYVGAKVYLRLAGAVGLSLQARYIVASPGNSPSEEALAVSYKF